MQCYGNENGNRLRMVYGKGEKIVVLFFIEKQLFLNNGEFAIFFNL